MGRNSTGGECKDVTFLTQYDLSINTRCTHSLNPQSYNRSNQFTYNCYNKKACLFSPALSSPYIEILTRAEITAIKRQLADNTRGSLTSGSESQDSIHTSIQRSANFILKSVPALRLSQQLQFILYYSLVVLVSIYLQVTTSYTSVTKL